MMHLKNKINPALTEKEKMFCRWYAWTGNAREAAVNAGYHLRPEKAALRLRARQEIREHTDACAGQSGFRSEAVAGLRRLAFGSGCDALRLLQSGTDSDPRELDLFNVSEIKCPKSGGIEIKFYDRQKALEKLAELNDSGEEAAGPFYQALQKSGQNVSLLLKEERYVH